MFIGLKFWKGNESDRVMRYYREPLGLRQPEVEVELSDYQRLPDGEALSPSDLLKGESSKSEVIVDLDRFFERVYLYYCEKGLWCIVIQWLVELLSLGFTICFSGFFLLFVNWHGLRTMRCGVDALEEGIKPCDIVKEALNKQPFRPFTIYKAAILTYLIIFSLYWIFCFVRFFTQLKETLEIRKFYYSSLGVTDYELQTLSWPVLLDKIVQFQHLKQLCIVRELSAHDVVMRIMRKENYLIGMLNKGILALPIPSWVPGAGPVFHEDRDGMKKRLLLTKTLEWSLYWCMLQNMFDRKFLIRNEFTNNPSWLKRRLMMVGFGILLLSPFLIIFMFVYFFLRHAEEFYQHPSIAASRRWSNLAKWIFREFNELDHLFKRRLNSSFKHAVEYMRQFPSLILSLIAKFVAFVTGGIAAVLIIIAFLDESLLEAHLFGRNLLWFTAVFGTIAAISRSAITEEFQVFEPANALHRVAFYTHYMPKRWRGAENKDSVRAEVEILFQYTGMTLFEELMSIFVTPYVLLFLLPKQVDDVMQFIREFTVHVEGVGDVCSLSMYDFERHGNSKYGSPFQTSKDKRSCQGKMEKSFLSFMNSYPKWEPDASGKQFVSILTAAQLKNNSSEVAPSAYPSSHYLRFPSLKYFERTSRLPFIYPGHQYSMSVSHRDELTDTAGKLRDDMWYWPLEQDQLYWLIDQYYTSITSHSFKMKGSDSQTIGFSTWNESRTCPVRTSRLKQDERAVAEKENNADSNNLTGWSLPDIMNRRGSINEATSRISVSESSMSHLFDREVMCQGNTDSTPFIERFAGHWWARAPPETSLNNGSFLEPPISMLQRWHNSTEANYTSIVESEIGHVGTSTFRGADSSLLDDKLCGFNLPFGDVYEDKGRPPQVTRDGH